MSKKRKTISEMNKHELNQYAAMSLDHALAFGTNIEYEINKKYKTQQPNRIQIAVRASRVCEVYASPDIPYDYYHYQAQVRLATDKHDRLKDYDVLVLALITPAHEVKWWIMLTHEIPEDLRFISIKCDVNGAIDPDSRYGKYHVGLGTLLLRFREWWKKYYAK